MLWRKRVQHAALRRTGIWALLDAASAPAKRIEVTRHVVAAPVARPLTVALLADLHLAERNREIDEMLAIVRTERPDVIVLAGDVTSLHGNDSLYLEVLRGLAAPGGVWMVPGNWDHWAPMADARSVLERSGVRLLVNASTQIDPGVWLAGVDDAVAGSPDPEAALCGIPPGAWVMAVVHCPVGFDEIAGRCAIALAGHTHGGQIRVPGLPALWLPAGCRPYVSGWYERQGSRMYVSRGIAAPGIPVRMFCRPEIAMFKLSGAEFER
jgi:predicted MPP superfamily phosphohydrolase